MSRSDWGLVAALIGCLALACAALSSSYPQEKGYQAYRYAADKPLELEPSIAGVTAPQTLGYRRPCEQPKGKDESDLCAQWRAARAAENSAFWAKWGFWVAVIGSGFLLYQIVLTRRAVEDTGDATKAMAEANLIAERSQRPYITPHEWKLVYCSQWEVGPPPHKPTPMIKLTGAIKNTGQGVAFLRVLHIAIGQVGISEGASTASMFGVVIGPGNVFVPSGVLSGIGGDGVGPTSLSGAADGPQYYVHGWMLYSDAFGKLWKTHFRLLHSNHEGGLRLYADGGWDDWKDEPDPTLLEEELIFLPEYEAEQYRRRH